MKKTIYCVLATAFLMSSCSTEPITIKEGESFDFNGQKITVDISSASLLSNNEEKSTIIAPEGKLYLKVDVNAEKDSYFLNVKEGENKLEEVDYLIAKPFVNKADPDNIMDPNKSKLYLVDSNNSNVKVEIKSYSDEVATLSVEKLQDEASFTVLPEMIEFKSAFKDGARLSEVIQKFIPKGSNTTDFIKESGMEVASDPIVKGVKIVYAANENTYECSSEFGVDRMTVTWSGNLIQKVVFK